MATVNVHKRKKTIDVHRLPPELLSLILRQATLLPGLLDPPDTVELPYRKSVDKELFRKHRISLVTKRYLVLVCWDWHALATPFLYESVLIDKVKTLHGLCEGLNRPLGDDNSIRTGVFVKRIDYRRTLPSIPDSVDTGDPRLLPTIFSRTPNLRILELFMDNDSVGRLPDPDNAPAILNAIPPGLKTFSYTYSTYAVGPHWVQFFSTHTQLQSCVAELITAISPMDPQFSLPEVQTLIVHCGLPLAHVFAKVDFPNVRRLVWFSHRSRLPHPLGGGILLNDHLSALVPIFTSLGNQLTVVEVHPSVLRDDERSPWQSMCQTIQQYCPRLGRIDLVWSDVDDGTPYFSPFSTQVPFRFPTSVTTLGVRKLTRPMALHDVRYLFDRLPRWAQSGGQLRTVQFTDKADVDAINRMRKLNVRKRVHELAELGIIMLDDEGQPLDLPDPRAVGQVSTT